MVVNKCFKYIIRTLIWGIFILYIGLSVFLNLPFAQKKMTAMVSSTLEQILNTEVSVGHISLDIFRRIIVEDVLLRDKQGHEMITVSRLSARYEPFSLLEDKITINSIQLLGFSVQLNKETPASEANIQFLLDAFAQKDSVKKETNLDLRINSVLIRRGNVSYDVQSIPETPGKFNPSHIGIKDFEATISVKALKSDSLNATIRRLAFTEKSGLELKKIGVRLVADNNRLQINDFTIQLPNSTIGLDNMEVKFDSLQHLPHMTSDVDYKGELKASLSLPDFSPIVPQLKGLTNPICIQTSFNGQGKNIDLSELSISDQRNLELHGNASVSNWDAGRDMYLQAQLTDFSISRLGLKYFFNNLTGNVPPIIERMNYIKFKGATNGFLHNLRVNGKAETSAGLLTADVWVKTNDERKRTYTGKFASYNLNLGKLFNEKKLGKTRFNVEVKGLDMKGNYPEAYIKGIVNSFEYSNYQYKDIALDGIYKDGGFDGHLSLNDENGCIQIDGIFNLTKAVPSLNLHASVRNFRPNKLNLSDKYVDSDISFNFNANFRGNTIDDIEGKICMDSLIMHAPNNQGYSLESFKLQAIQDANEKILQIDSPFIDMIIRGNYSYQTIPVSIKQMLQQNLPSLSTTNKISERSNDFQFDIHIIDTELFKKMFYIPIELHMPASLSGYINDSENRLHIEGYFPKFSYKGKLYESGTFLCENLSKEFNCQLHGSMLMGSGAMLNLSVNSKAENDQIKTVLNWGNNTDVTYSGQFATLTRFTPSDTDSLKLQTDIEILPSTIVLSDSIWYIRPSHIEIDNEKFYINNLSVERPEQHLKINGNITDKHTDSCMVDLKNIDVQYVLDMLRFQAVQFGGLATGKVLLKQIFDTPIINASLHVRDFSVNKGLMGDADILGVWDNELPGIRLEANIAEEQLSTTRVTGYVSPKLKALDLNIQADSTNIDLLSPYLDGIFSELDGRVNGHVRLHGGFKTLDFEGAVSVWMDTKLDALNTYFQIHNDSVLLSSGSFALDNVRIYDREGNMGKVNGALNHTHLRDLKYHFDIQSENMLLYDTQDDTNELFYGKVYGTGNVNVNGGNNSMNVNATFTTGPNTTFTYINGVSSEAANNQFITFVDKTPKRIQDSIQTEIYHHTDLNIEKEDNGPSMDLRINMKIDANPNANMKVIMDPIAGDNITARGNGNFQVDFYNKGDFRIFGHYTVDDGMYKLNMQDIIRKDFAIQSGSTITFTGDPYLANLDVQAIYTVNSVSLSDLTTDVSQNQSTIKVNCIMNLTGSLANPSINFDLDLPSVSEEDREMVRSLVSTEEQMNTQIIYLLGIGKFYAYNYTENTNRSNATSSLAFSTLSSQLNNMISQVMENKNWNIGANLSSGQDGWNGVEAEAILSGRLLNNRLLINGNFGYRENVMTNTNFIGDFEAIWLLTPNGEFRIRGYNQTNDRYFSESTLTTQGIGLIYKKDFNKWNELYRLFIRKRNKYNEQNSK